MAPKKDINIEIIELGKFQVLFVKARPNRLETKVIFSRDDISQKLVFMLMNISHKCGFGCSSPKFNLPDEDSMTFLVGTIVPNRRSLDKYLVRLHVCLQEISEFMQDFKQQLNFDYLNLSMFEGVDAEDIYPEQLAALRDQNHGGSWQNLYDSLIVEGRSAEADIVARCVRFEQINNKDIGLVGHRLDYILQTFSKLPATSTKLN
jgi:hypothetical protein